MDGHDHRTRHLVLSLLQLSSKIAFALVGLGTYLRLFTDFSAIQFSLGVLVVIVAINILGVSKASGLQIAIVLFCIACLLVMTGMGMKTVDPALFEPAFPEGAGGILSGAAFVFVSYAGVTKIASIAEEVSNPARNIPLGMLAAQLTAMMLYAGIAWLITGHTPYQDLATDITPITTTAHAIFGPQGSFFFAVVAVVALISMANAGVLATSRKPFAMSRDNMMPDRPTLATAINRSDPQSGQTETRVFRIFSANSLMALRLARRFNKAGIKQTPTAIRHRTTSRTGGVKRMAATIPANRPNLTTRQPPPGPTIKPGTSTQLPQSAHRWRVTAKSKPLDLALSNVSPCSSSALVSPG